MGQRAGFFYWIDVSSTAEYGVDYKTSGGVITFYGGKVPSPKIIPAGTSKNKTVVILNFARAAPLL